MKELIKPPLPGKVLNILVSEGQEIKKGQVLFILEAMKMHNEIFSNFDGKISKIFIKEESTVSINTNILEIEKL